MGNNNSKPEQGFSRTNLLGLDIITIREPSLIQSVSALPEVTRVAEVAKTPDDLPWLFRWFFPKTRFYNPALRGWFLPFRGTSDETYAPCRAFMDERFGQEQDISAAVAKTVRLLTDKDKPATDRQLADAAIEAIWGYIVPPGHPAIPEEHLAAASNQIGEVTDSFVPWKVLRARAGTAGVFEYVDNVLQSVGLRGGAGAAAGLPDAAVTDAAHPFFAMAKNAPAVLRRLAEQRDGEDVSGTLCAIGPVENTPRMVKTASRLGELLPSDEPAEPGKTVVLFAIREVAAKTGDATYVFSGGPGQRMCAARGVVEKYFEDVKAELGRVRQPTAE